MSKEGDKRRAALTRFKSLTGIYGALSVVVLICAGLGTKHYESDTYAPPYYIGGFIVGPLAFITALVSASIAFGAIGESVEDNHMLRLAPKISCQYTMSMILLPACFIGSVLTGIWGLDAEHKINRNLATTILVGCVLIFCVNVVSMCTVCSYGKYFGVNIDKHGRRNVMIGNNSNFAETGERSSESSGGVTVHNNMNVFTTETRHQRVSDLEQQNRLLQQQLALQQQLMMQQQQPRQNQPPPFPNGTYPPPPSYHDLDPAFPPPSGAFLDPSAPPPPYSK